MSGGGEGLLAMREIMDAWRREADNHPRVFFVAVCGKNGRLKRQLSQMTLPYLRVLGFIENFAEYIKAADLVISKAGGLTAAEVIAGRRPLIIYRPLPGQEFINTDRLVKQKLALLAKSPQEACRMIVDGAAGGNCLTDEIKTNQQAAGKPFAAQDAARGICALLQGG
jgi:processive 1,2-diacylglycerol beta-glucosyltransferase